MKFVRYGMVGHEKPGVFDISGRIRDLSAIVRDICPETLQDGSVARVTQDLVERQPFAPPGQRIGACVGKVRNLIAVGLNYADHAAEANAKLPKEPILFHKAPSCIVGPNDDVIIPREAIKTDWEVELAVVIGKVASYVSADDALRYVAGYTICNDVSEREYQLEREGTWSKGKGCATFGPLGPWLVTPDEIADPQKLDLWLNVNGERMQTGNTRDMLFGVRELIAYISKFMILEPGDVVSTGTPPGVGLGMKPPRFLKRGDVMHLGVDGLGEQRQTCV